MEDNKLSEKQIENWRRILSLTFGPYAFVMPAEEIQKHRDNMQMKIDNEGEKNGREKS